MIVYNRTWLANLILIDSVKKDYDEGMIPDDEWAAIRLKYTHQFYSPNIFIRAGLFLLTIVISAFSTALLTLFMAESGIVENSGWILFLAIANYIALEVIVQQKFHFRSGVDDALLWISGGLFTFAFVTITNADQNYLALSAFVFVVSAFLSLRFADALMALVGYASILAVVFYSWQELGTLGTSTMPFLIMLFSGAIYWVIRLNINNPKTRFYANSLDLLQIASLLSLYAAGNYFAVKELGDMLNGSVSKSIPLGWFFWIWTMGLPFIYIFSGLKQKNVILLRMGLILIGVAALTYKNYYKLMSLELTFIICGTLAVALSYFLIRYLKQPKHGFTYKELSKVYLMDELKVESLVISESFAETGVPPDETGTALGGGRFGGGGAASGY